MKQKEIERLLPGIFRRTIRPGNPLHGLLGAMEALQEPDEELLGHLDDFFNPYRTPDRFVPFLGTWLDLARFLLDSEKERSPDDPPGFPPGIGCFRELIIAAVFLSKWRGTAKGLRCFLETATGIQGFAIIEQAKKPDGVQIPFHIKILAPAEAEPFRRLIERITEMEKPVYVTHEIGFVSRKGGGNV